MVKACLAVALYRLRRQLLTLVYKHVFYTYKMPAVQAEIAAKSAPIPHEEL